MQSAEIDDLRVGPYLLGQLERVRCDDLAAFLGPSPGVYVCNAPTPAWFARHGRRESIPSTLEKKRSIFGRMAAGSLWISPTFVAGFDRDTYDLLEGDILHIGYGRRRGRSAQAVQTLKMLRWLFERRSSVGYFLLYNLPLPWTLAPLTARLGTAVKLIVDYEDDCTVQRRSVLKNGLEFLLRSQVHGAICITEQMCDLFNGKPTCVVNCFADLTHDPHSPVYREGMRLMYSGTLDEVRGVDLIPDLVQSLRARLSRFSIRISGDGPLRREVESWRLPEVQYLGLLPQAEFENELARADAFLVLQRPDHPFSRFSYPSKIQTYARCNRPVLVLSDRNGFRPW